MKKFTPKPGHTLPSAPNPHPWQRAVADGQQLVAQWDSLPLRDRGVVKDCLQSIVASLAAIVLAGNRLDGVWSGSVLDTLIKAEIVRRKTPAPHQRMQRSA
jgi:hypothetical protein